MQNGTVMQLDKLSTTLSLKDGKTLNITNLIRKYICLHDIYMFDPYKSLYWIKNNKNNHMIDRRNNMSFNRIGLWVAYKIENDIDDSVFVGYSILHPKDIENGVIFNTHKGLNIAINRAYKYSNRNKHVNRLPDDSLDMYPKGIQYTVDDFIRKCIKYYKPNVDQSVSSLIYSPDKNLKIDIFPNWVTSLYISNNIQNV
jgi:hypothetical protein